MPPNKTHNVPGTKGMHHAKSQHVECPGGHLPMHPPLVTHRRVGGGETWVAGGGVGFSVLTQDKFLHVPGIKGITHDQGKDGAVHATPSPSCPKFPQAAG